MTDEKIDRTIVQPAADRAHTSHRGLYLLGVVFFLSLVVAAIVLFQQHGQIGDLSATVASQHQDKVDLQKSVDALAEQVTRLGGTPVVEPGQAGQTGAQGLPGRDGTPGRDGQSPACLATAQQCQGATGATGPAGKDGADGAEGPAGKDGTPGAAGKDGADGAPGVAGKDGQPPSGWTTTYPDGSVETCSRASNFDPAAPKYTCTVNRPGQPPATLPTAVLPAGIRRIIRGS